jgi:hypothetical protein
MFRTLTGRRTGRGMAVGALILSLTATIGGTASAAPTRDETTDDMRGCSVLAHERNEGRHRLQNAWQMFNDQLRELQREARQLDRDSKKTKSASSMTSEAREALDGAKSELQSLRTNAQGAIQELAELGQACKEEQETEDQDAHVTLVSLVESEDGVVTLLVQFNEKVECTSTADDGKACAELFSYMPTEDGDPVKGETFELAENEMSAVVTFVVDEDLDDDENVEVDVTKDELKFTAGSALSAQDAGTFESNEAADAPVDLALETNDLVAKYRDVVDEAILDMQSVMDEITAAFTEMAEAAETTTTEDDTVAAAELEQSKQDRAKEKVERVKEAKEKAERAKDRTGNGNKDKGAGKGKARN